MKKHILISFLWVILLCLSWCWNSYDLKIESWDITRNPSLKANLQVISFNEDNWDMMFQEIADEWNNDLDTLVIASDTTNAGTTSTNLSSYVQTSINHLKLIWWYDLSKEKSKKTSVGEWSNAHPAILKTFNIVSDWKQLSVAQLFVEKSSSVLMLSYASTESSHTKRFISELSSIQTNF